MTRRFTKMHGLGNDFVVLDHRALPPTAAAPSAAQIRRIADRMLGVGCDQVIVLVPAPSPDATVGMRIFNRDGGEVAACGNATRCVARLLAAEGAGTAPVIETAAGRLGAEVARDGTRVAVDLGVPRFGWAEIPLARPMDTRALELALDGLRAPVAVNLGNPHAVFFVADAAAVEATALDRLGPRLEVDPLFPERANIGVAALLGPDRLRLRVWERGAGLTRACGTGASAAAVAAIASARCARRPLEVVLDGGAPTIDWRAADDHVLMTGPTAIAFTGILADELFAGA